MGRDQPWLLPSHTCSMLLPLPFAVTGKSSVGLLPCGLACSNQPPFDTVYTVTTVTVKVTVTNSRNNNVYNNTYTFWVVIS